MSAVDTKFYEKKKSASLVYAWIFVVFSLAVAIGLFVYNSRLEKNIVDLESKSKEITASINTLNDDDEVQIYKVYKINQSFFKELDDRSNISSFITHLQKQFSKYDISAKWFNYSDWVVKTSLSASSNETWDAYEKIVRMVEEYSLDENASFEIGDISRYEWYDRINFPWEFTLKTQINENFE